MPDDATPRAGDPVSGMGRARDAARQRTYEWPDPARALQRITTMSGLEYLGAILSGELSGPPAMSTFGIRPKAVREGEVVFELVPAEFQYNTMGAIHGGVIATVLDTAAGCAVHSALPIGVGYTTTDLKVAFLRAATVESGVLTCTGRLLHLGSRLAMSEARLEDTTGRLMAHATSSCMIFRDRQG